MFTIKAPLVAWGSTNEPYIRLKRLNRLAKALGSPQRYLEIGVESGRTLFAVDIPNRTGVDPFPTFAENRIPPNVQFWRETSDEFFSHYIPAEQFEIVLVDGLHEWEQAFRDIMNAFLVLTRGGVVVVDDILPIDRFSANPDRSVADRARKSGLIDHDFWFGDTWKALVAVIRYYPEIELAVMGNRSRRNHGQAFLWRREQSDNFTKRALTAHQFRELRDLEFEQFFSRSGVPREFQRLRDTSSSYRKIVRRAQ